MGRRKEKHGARADPPSKKANLISFNLEHLDAFRDKVYMVHGAKCNWTTHFYRGIISGEDYLICDIYCHSFFNNMVTDNKFDIRIANKPIHKIEARFQHRKNCMSCPPFMKWKDFIDPKNCYIKNGKASVQIYVTEEPKKILKNSMAFTEEYPGIKNLEIRVGKAKFFVNKDLFAFTSKHFTNVLNCGMLESPYVIEDVSPIDFKLYLDLTYLPKQYFSAYHAKDILAIARRFDNAEIVQACQNVLVEDLNENKLSAKEKAKLTEAYDLETVKDLFNPANVLPAAPLPRFMEKMPPLDPEYRKESDAAMLHVSRLCENLKEQLKELPKYRTENSTPSPVLRYSRPPRSSPSMSSADSLPKLDYENEVIVIGDTDDEEEKEEEDFDISIQSTSKRY